jgi:hypothetical protein
MLCRAARVPCENLSHHKRDKLQRDRPSAGPELLLVLIKEKTMKTPKYFILAIATVLFAVQFAYVSPTHAQVQDQAKRDHLAYVMDPNTNIEEFRQEYESYRADMESDLRLVISARGFPNMNRQTLLDSLEVITAAKREIASMAPEELAKVREVYSKVPGWRNPLLVPGLRRLIAEPQAVKGRTASKTNEITPDTCPNAADVPSATDISLYKILTVIPAHGASDIIPEEIILAKGLAVAAVAVSEVALVGFETTRTIHLECLGAFKSDIEELLKESRKKLIFDLGVDFGFVNEKIDQKTDLIVTNDNTNRDTILASLGTNTTNITTAVTNAKTEIVNNDNSNKTQIINNDNTNTTAIVNNANANTLAITNSITVAKNDIVANANANKNELKDLMLRTQIEADLAEADSASFVGLYLTPASKGGYFEFARSIVVETIANLAGSNTSKANQFLAQSDASRAAGDFRSAYASLRKAYKAAVN